MPFRAIRPEWPQASLASAGRLALLLESPCLERFSHIPTTRKSTIAYHNWLFQMRRPRYSKRTAIKSSQACKRLERRSAVPDCARFRQRISPAPFAGFIHTPLFSQVQAAVCSAYIAGMHDILRVATILLAAGLLAALFLIRTETTS